MISSINQTNKFNGTSEKYNFVNTMGIIERLNQHGWEVRKTSETKVRDKDKQGFQKHMVRLQNPEFKAGEDFIEIVLINSHIGNSSVQLSLGVYRLICLNGLVAGKSYFNERIRHTGFTYEKLDKALERVIMQAPKLIETIERMKNMQLTYDEAYSLASKSILKRFDTGKNREIYANIPSVLRSRRMADRGTDLYTIYNVIQEKVIRGGVKYNKVIRSFDENTGRPITTESLHTTRGINSINKNIELNTYIFDQAVELLEAA